mgnify:CR=1 FL=1
MDNLGQIQHAGNRRIGSVRFPAAFVDQDTVAPQCMEGCQIFGNVVNKDGPVCGNAKRRKAALIGALMRFSFVAVPLQVKDLVKTIGDAEILQDPQGMRARRVGQYRLGQGQAIQQTAQLRSWGKEITQVGRVHIVQERLRALQSGFQLQPAQGGAVSGETGLADGECLVMGVGQPEVSLSGDRL